MAEPVVKKGETKEIKNHIQSAKPNQIAAAVALQKERETDEVKPLHETVKPDQIAEAVANERIAITVKNQDGKITFFQIRRDAKLKKLLICYCKKCSVHYPSARFLINGDPFNHEKTADEIELEDETEIEVMVETFGGGKQSFAWISAN